MAFGKNGLSGVSAALPVAMEAGHENVCAMGHGMEVRNAQEERQNGLCATLVNAFQVMLAKCVIRLA